MAVPVGVAVVCDRDHVLVGIRPATSTLPGKAEFPGGKCFPEESFSDCAVRECLEETGLSVVPERRLHATTHVYSHAAVNIEFWLCRPLTIMRTSEDHRGFRWIPRGELAQLDFPDANRAVLEHLIHEPLEEFGDH